VDREQQSSRPGATRATPPKSRSKPESAKASPTAAKPRAAASRAKGAGGTPPATSAPDIMSRLPKSRPQHSSQRRRAPVGAAKSTSGRSPSAPKRPVSTGARRPAAARPATPARPPAAQSRSAPGLPRLAIDGATEAVKLPLKVSGRLTLRALDAVARGLRRR
jgi:hypothetical protein